MNEEQREVAERLVADQSSSNLEWSRQVVALLRELLAAEPARADAPIGYLTRFKSQVEDAEKCFPGELHDHLWSYTHGTKKMEYFASFPDIEVVPVYATPRPAKGLSVQADAEGEER